MKSRIALLFVFGLMLTLSSEAQKLKVVSGKLKDLSSYKSYNMVYTYNEGLKIGKKTEESYLEEKRVKKNEAEAGTGDAWVAKWEENKGGGRFFDKFETLFNDVLSEKGVSGSRDNADADCTIQVNVYYLDPGFNVGVTRRPAFLSTTATFVVDGNEIAKVDMVKAPGQDGMGFDFDAAYRIQESFAKTAKTLAKTMAKQAYK